MIQLKDLTPDDWINFLLTEGSPIGRKNELKVERLLDKYSTMTKEEAISIVNKITDRRKILLKKNRLYDGKKNNR